MTVKIDEVIAPFVDAVLVRLLDRESDAKHAEAKKYRAEVERLARVRDAEAHAVMDKYRPALDAAYTMSELRREEGNHYAERALQILNDARGKARKSQRGKRG